MRTKNGLRFVPDVGGGICRVSTAIHQAVLKAGLKVIERHPHSLPVAYATPGMDAAVSWGAWDYRFQNTTHYPIKLAAAADENKISVRVLALPHTNPVE